MFTGIVEEVGRVRAIDVADGHARLSIAATRVVEDVAVGDSISVDGCCLTATLVTADGFVCDLMAETLRVTALGGLSVGAPVNLERAMSAAGRFGGHLVQGHVDAVGVVTDRQDLPGTVFLSVRAGPEVSRYVVGKGSITVSGTSLTVVDVVEDGFRVGLIPHTLEATNLGGLGEGARVNLEVDVVAKYVERLLTGGSTSPYAPTGAEEAP